MIILDTNVVSELMRTRPSPVFLEWASQHESAIFYTTAITKAEIYYGIFLLAQGQKRARLEVIADTVFSATLEGRILPFDGAAAEEYAPIATARKRLGRPIGQSDGQIASIVSAYGARLATRNISDFEGCGIRLINPWQEK